MYLPQAQANNSHKIKSHWLWYNSQQYCNFHKHKPTSTISLPSGDQGISNKLLVSMKCEILQGIQPLMMESFLFLKNDTSNDGFFFNFPFKHRNEGLFPSVYIRSDRSRILYRIQQSQLPWFQRPILRQDMRCFRQERFFPYHFHKY